jgi:hypothetical protein
MYGLSRWSSPAPSAEGKSDYRDYHREHGYRQAARSLL